MAKGPKKAKVKGAEKPAAVPSASVEQITVDHPKSAEQSSTLLTEAPEQDTAHREVIPGIAGQQAAPVSTNAAWSAAQPPAAAAPDDDGWGPVADEGSDMWGGGSAASAAGGADMDWGMPGGAAVGGWDQPASAWTPASAKESGDKRGGSAFVPPPPASFAAAAPSPALTAGTATGGWGNAQPSWGAPPPSGWAQSAGGWDEPQPSGWPGPAPPPAPPPPPMSAPSLAGRPSGPSGAWKNWGNEARGLPKSQPGPPADRQQQAAMHQQAVAALQQHMEQQRRLQTMPQQARAQPPAQPAMHRQGYPSQVHRAPPMQQADSWGSNGSGAGGWNSNWPQPIPEEEEGEEEEEYDEYDEEEYGNDGYGYGGGEDGGGYGQRVRFSPAVSYHTEPPTARGPRPYGTPMSAPPPPPPPPAAAAAAFTPSAYPQAIHPSFWTDEKASKTMDMATGRHTTVFELASPRNGLGENAFIESRGQALMHAQRAFFSRSRPAKERIYWAFNPNKDDRVASLLRWVQAMSNGLATIGLQKFLQTGERGALITNADYRVGTPAQPAFDWINMAQLQLTLDRILQESVALYDPSMQVIVFVFLLSNSGNSMAVWRRKVPVPESLRQAYEQDIMAAKENLEQDYPVYVEELPPKPEEKPKKKRNLLSKLKWRKKAEKT